MRRPRLVGAVASVAFVVGAVLFVAPAGNAASASPSHAPSSEGNGTVLQRFDYAGSGVNIRTGPSTNRTIVGQGNPGDGIVVHCNTRNNWYRHTNQRTGVTGYSKYSLLKVPDGYMPAPC